MNLSPLLTKVTLFELDTTLPATNLACEEYLLERVGTDELYIVLYINQQSVIIGKNQNPWLECSYAGGAGEVALCRRISGGGAVYHDQGNLNFAFISGRHLPPCAINHIMGDFLRTYGLAPSISGTDDLLVQGMKVSGRAKYYRGHRVLEHGTLLVNVNLERLALVLTPPATVQILANQAVLSRRAQVANLRDFLPDLVASKVTRDFGDFLLARFAQRRIQRSLLNFGQLARVKELMAKHDSDEWVYRRTPAFTLAVAVGAEGMRVSVERGRIVGVAVDDRQPAARLPMWQGALFDWRTMGEEGCKVWGVLPNINNLVQ